MPIFLSLASRKTKESGDESEGSGHSSVADAGASPQSQENGTVGSDKHGTSRRVDTGERSQ